MRRRPPDILITTPESLYLMLTSGAREILTGVEAVIVDEIHAVAGTKRGSHLALTLERLTALQADGSDPQRIGLSATQNPLEEIGRYLVGPRRTCRVIDAGVRKELDLHIHVPVESMVEPDQGRPAEEGDLVPVLDGAATRRSIWPAIYPEILRLVEEHTSTIVFVNARRGAERLALRLNELANARLPEDAAPVEIARAHHGSLAREERTVIEDLLKAGRAPVPGRDLVAGARDRHGRRRPRHPGGVAEVGQPRAAADRPRGARRRRAQRGPHLPEVPRRPARVRGRHAAHARRADRADGRPAQRARRARPADRRDRRGRGRRRAGRRRRPARARDADALLRRAAARAAGERARHARRALPVGRVRRAAAADRVGPRRRDDPAARGRRPAGDHERRDDPRPRALRRRPAGRPARRRARRGDGLRGAARPDVPARRVDVADRGDHPRPRDRHARARRARAPSRSGRATASAARRSWGSRSARSRAPRWSGRPRSSRSSTTSTRSRRATSSTTCASSRTPRASSRATARSSSSASATRSATGGCACCPPTAAACTPPGRSRSRRGCATSWAWSPTRSGRTRGSSSTCPTRTSRRAPTPSCSNPTTLEDQVVAELGASALFGARFRENAARALLIPRAYPGRRTPLWQQRLKAQSLLEVAKRYADFPIILETYRECLRDVLDVPGLHDLLHEAPHARAVARRGGDADRLPVRERAAVRLRRDVHVRGRHAQRRAARGRAVAGPRPAARAARPGRAARPDRPGRAGRASRTTCSTARSARAPGRATRSATSCGGSAT